MPPAPQSIDDYTAAGAVVILTSLGLFRPQEYHVEHVAYPPVAGEIKLSQARRA
jgi:hypothetical protein